jgi:hypothetical protein
MHVSKRLLAWSGALACALALSAAPARASGPFLEPDAVLIRSFATEQPGDNFGWVAENLGDIDGDGVNDFVTTAPSNDQAAQNAGKAYVFSGGDGAPLNAVPGSRQGEQFGYSASTAGDVNRDGVPDYVVGGLGTASVPGRVVVFSGADHAELHVFAGAPGEQFGASATGAGDVNGDGYGDVIVGAQGASFSGAQAGRVYVFSGKDGEVIWTRDGRAAGDMLGSAVGKVGDVSGDGVPDLSVGAMGAGKQGGGQAYVLSGANGSRIYTLKPTGKPVVFGQFFASGAGDINDDGVPDVFVADYNALHGKNDLNDQFGLGTGRAYVFSGRDGSRLYILKAEHKDDGFGPGRGIGDVNGDGYDDLIVAAYTSSAGAQLGGKAFVYSGRDGSVLRTITDTIPFDLLGVDALAAGDVNGDGLTDYILTTLSSVYIVAGTPL